MGRTKKTTSALAKRGSAIDLAREDDTGSMGSSVITWTTCQETFETEIDLFSQAIDDLFEKRGSTREKALATLIAYLRDNYRDEDAAANETTLVSRCVNGIRRGSTAEAVLSAQLLGLVVLSLPAPGENIVREAQYDLVRAAGADNPPEVRSSALEALALLTFVAAEDEELTLDVMDKCRGLWTKGDARGRAAAIRAWSFLFTSLRSVLSSQAVEGILSLLAKLLHDSDVEVRNAAGEAVSLLYHCCGLKKVLERVEEEEEEEDEFDEDGEEAGGEEDSTEVASVVPPSIATSAGTTGEGGGKLGDVVGRMRDLATGHKCDKLRRSRRDKASLKGTFRSIIALLDNGHVPTTRIKLTYGDTLVVDTVEGNVMLTYLRRFLAGGFQAHLMRNPLLHDVFSFTPSTTRPERMSALEKRHFRSPSSYDSKARTHERKGDRALKASRQAAALHG